MRNIIVPALLVAIVFTGCGPSAAELKTAVGNVPGIGQTPQFGNYGGTEGDFIFVTTKPQDVPTAPGTRAKSERARTNPIDGAIALPAAASGPTSGFWLYRTPVTNEQYRLFLSRGGHAPPAFWNDPRFNQPDQPVVGVSWQDAADYCEWAHCRLPTEAEWKLAAYGTDGREYPWGAEKPDATRAVFGRDKNSGRPAPAGSCEAGAGPYGHLDLVGNVRQWCADWFGRTPGIGRVVRGGSWSDGVAWLNQAGRHGQDPVSARNEVGFRPVLLP